MDCRHKTSQYGQDEVMEKLCYSEGFVLNESMYTDDSKALSQHCGIFLEIGAYDGYTISNCYYLEKMKGWKGVLVEPLKIQADFAIQNRWNPVWNGAVYNKNGSVLFTEISGYSDMLSGIEEAYSPYLKDRVKQEIKQYDLQYKNILVECKTLNKLMDDYGFKCADYLSLDAQTAELSILKAYDCARNPIKCIGLDMNNSNVTDLKLWFHDHGYEVYWKHEIADEYIYINKDIPWSWDVKSYQENRQ